MAVKPLLASFVTLVPQQTHPTEACPSGFFSPARAAVNPWPQVNAVTLLSSLPPLDDRMDSLVSTCRPLITEPALCRPSSPTPPHPKTIYCPTSSPHFLFLLALPPPSAPHQGCTIRPWITWPLAEPLSGAATTVARAAAEIRHRSSSSAAHRCGRSPSAAGRPPALRRPTRKSPRPRRPTAPLSLPAKT